MGKKNRADRRHHHQRMIEKVKDFWWLQASKYWGSEEKRQRHIRKMAETRKPCSCDMCCNVRRNPLAKGERLTMQERKIIESMKDNDYEC